MNIMMVGEAFSLRDQMLCNEQDLSEIDNYLNVYHKEEAAKKEALEEEAKARM